MSFFSGKIKHRKNEYLHLSNNLIFDMCVYGLRVIEIIITICRIYTHTYGDNPEIEVTFDE